MPVDLKNKSNNAWLRRRSSICLLLGRICEIRRKGKVKQSFPYIFVR